MKLYQRLGAGFAVLLLAGAIIAAARGWVSSGSGYSIEAVGSTSVTPLMELLAERYMDIYPDREVRVNGTGSADGIEAAHSASVDFGMSSRELRDSETSGIARQLIARDAIAIIVHPENPVSELSMAQASAVFRGEITRWGELGSDQPGEKGPGGDDQPIVVVSREPGSGTRGAIESILGFRDRLAPGALELDGSGAVRAAVARNPRAIGYLSGGYLDGRVTPVAVDGEHPSAVAVAVGDYPIVRPFLLLYSQDLDPTPDAAHFLAWILSAEGQTLAATRWTAVR